MVHDANDALMAEKDATEKAQQFVVNKTLIPKKLGGSVKQIKQKVIIY